MTMPDGTTRMHLVYPALLVCCVGGLLLISLVRSGQEEQLVQDVLVLNEESEFDAIKGIHGQLDDNADGKLDFTESEEFVQMELHESSEKSQRFHETDQEITSEDLWKSWHENKVFNWSNDDVVRWLEGYVDLPQYSPMFRKYNITGRHLPRIANNMGQVLQLLLQISDSQHKHKVQLRALDVILFGPPNGVSPSYWKDAVLVLSITLSLLGVLYALRQRHSAQSRIDTFLESIRVYERELGELKERLEQQKDHENEATDGGDFPQNEATSSSGSASEEEVMSEEALESRVTPSLQRAHEEITLLRRRVWSLEAEVGVARAGRSTLQSLLREVHQKDWGYLQTRKKAAEDEVQRAQKVCDKIKRRRSSLIGTFRLANSSALEDAGLQITRAVNDMQKISASFDEYHKRWKKIEQACGFPITSTSSSSSFSSNPLSSPFPSYGKQERGSIMSLASYHSEPSYPFMSTAEELSRRYPLTPDRADTLPRSRGRSKQDSSQGSHYKKQHSAPSVPLSLSSSDISKSGSTSHRHENGTHIGRGLHQSASSPLIRKPSYLEAISTDSLPMEDLEGITFTILEENDSATHRKSLPNSMSRHNSRSSTTSSLDVIQEEGAKVKAARVQSLQSDSMDSLGEDSDQSGSELARRKKSKLKKRT